MKKAQISSTELESSGDDAEGNEDSFGNDGFSGDTLENKEQEANDEYDEYQSEHDSSNDYVDESLEENNQFQEENDGYNEMEEFSNDDSSEKTDPFGSFLKFELKLQGDFAPFENFSLGDGEFYMGEIRKSAK